MGQTGRKPEMDDHCENQRGNYNVPKEAVDQPLDVEIVGHRPLALNWQ